MLCTVVIAPLSGQELSAHLDEYQDLVNALHACRINVRVERPPARGGLQHAAADVVIYLLEAAAAGVVEVIVAGVVGTIGRRAARTRRQRTTHVVIFGPDGQPLRRVEIPDAPDEDIVVDQGP